MKRLVICCDGTGQDADGETLQSPSNVCLLSRAVKPISHKRTGESGETVEEEIAQIVYYQAGVGTSFGTITRLMGDATGAGLKQNVREAYGFICHNWSDGDEIYLFGFSRGAYTSRAIAGLISQFGLLTSRGMDGFWAVMKAYIAGKLKDGAPEKEKMIADLADKYERHTPHKPIPIKFVGVFDTVQAIGLPKVFIVAYDKKRVVEDPQLHPNIDFAYQALALDELRAPFQPNLWKLESTNTHTKMKQVWFPGVHCSVGGGDTYRGLSTVTLCWMAHKLTKRTDLELDIAYICASLQVFEPEIKGQRLDEKLAGWACSPWEPSYVGFYHLGGKRARKPGRYHRNLKEGETTNERIHHSVGVRQKNLSYIPPPLQALKFAKFGEMERDLRDKIWALESRTM